MPVKIDKAVDVVPSKQATEFQIQGFAVANADGSDPLVSIACAAGMRDSNGVFTASKTWAVEVKGAALAKEFAKPPKGASLYAAIKAALYSYLIAVGEFPQGVIS